MMKKTIRKTVLLGLCAATCLTAGMAFTACGNVVPFESEEKAKGPQFLEGALSEVYVNDTVVLAEYIELTGDDYSVKITDANGKEYELNVLNDADGNLAFYSYKDDKGTTHYLDKDTKDRLAKGERIVEVLKQGRNEPIAVELQIAIIYAVVNNLLKDVAVEDISRFEKGLFEYLTATRDDLLASIRDTGVLTDETTAELKDSILVYKEKFLNKA